VKLTDLLSSLDRSSHKDSNKIYFAFLMFLQISMDFVSLNIFL
jgi:hypothetical protein